jgi:general secretion pathway protein K
MRLIARAHKLKKQQGVAVVTALLLTTLAVTIVASLFWQQQVQVRSIENQRLQAQKKWVSRAVLSFTRLAVNLGTRGNYINSDQPWAQPVKDFRLSDFMAAGYRESADIDPSLSGKMEDAQGKFNLTNLVQSGKVSVEELATFERLLENLQLQKNLAKNIANFILDSVPLVQQPQVQAQQPQVQAQQPPLVGQAGTNNTSANTVTTVQSLRLTQVEDLSVIPGITPDVLAKLLPHVAILPVPTKVNLNTATPELLAAEINLAVQQAKTIRLSRKYFLSTAEFETSAQAVTPKKLNLNPLITTSDFFYVTGLVTLENARWTVTALIQKTGGPSSSQTQIVWARED